MTQLRSEPLIRFLPVSGGKVSGGLQHPEEG